MLLVVVTVVATLLVVPGGSAVACSCVGLTPAQAVADADMVLRGTVTDVARPSRLGLRSSTGPAEAELVAGVAQATGAGEPPRAAPDTQYPNPSASPVPPLPGERTPAAGDTAWLVPLVGGSVLALLLGAALVLVLVRGHTRDARGGQTPPSGDLPRR